MHLTPQYVIIFFLRILVFGFGHFSYALFDKDGQQVPQSIVTEVGVTFKKILEEVRPHSVVMFQYNQHLFVSATCIHSNIFSFLDG